MLQTGFQVKDVDLEGKTEIEVNKLFRKKDVE